LHDFMTVMLEQWDCVLRIEGAIGLPKLFATG
jgi:hypothetical protein